MEGRRVAEGGGLRRGAGVGCETGEEGAREEEREVG